MSCLTTKRRGNDNVSNVLCVLGDFDAVQVPSNCDGSDKMWIRASSHVPLHFTDQFPAVCTPSRHGGDTAQDMDVASAS